MYQDEIEWTGLLAGEQAQALAELMLNLVFGGCWSCGDLACAYGFNSVFECDASDDFGEVIEAA